MSWDDEFERELLRYSEVETIPKDQVEPYIPQTIQRYQQRIKLNNATSIFDADYTLEEANSNSNPAQGLDKSIDEDLGVFKDDKVTYYISGRGRGGRNIVMNPGEFNKNKVLNGDDEVRQQIRKVAPIGYSNEITESAIRAHKMAKVLARDPNANINHTSPAVSKPNSKPSSPALSTASSKANSISPESSGEKSTNSSPSKPISNKNLNDESPVLSGMSTPSTTQSDVASSDYFTSQDHNVSSSSSKSNRHEDESEESRDESSDRSAPSCSNISKNDDEHTSGAIAGNPVPLSVMLRRSREAHRMKQLARENGLDNGYSNEHINDLASRKTIVAILHQDHRELQMRKKSEKSSSSGLSSNDSLSWRRRSNSPPRYPWGREEAWKKPCKKLDINSMEDFPVLK